MQLNTPIRMLAGAAAGAYGSSYIPELPEIGPLSPELGLIILIAAYFLFTGGMDGDIGEVVDGALIGVASVAATRLTF